jgi:exonuclease SbcC
MASFLQKMFKPRAFKPQWQHEDASIRIEAITPELPYDTLVLIARNDEAQTVRLKAITLLHTLSDLAALFGDKNPSIKESALNQYLQIATGAAGTQQQIDNLVDIGNNHPNATEILLIIASASNHSKLAKAAMDLVHDEAALFEFIMQSNSAKARIKAAGKITTLSMLKEIEAKFKGKDKTLNRLAKNKIQEQLNAEAETETKKKKTESLLKQCQQLTVQAFSPTYEGQLAHLKQAWTKAEFTEHFNAEFSDCISQCEIVLSAHKEQQDAINAQQQLTIKALVFHNKAIEQIATDVKGYKERSPKSSDEVGGSLAQIEASWHQAEQLSKADSSLALEYSSELTMITNIHQALIKLDGIDEILNKKLTNIDSMVMQKKAIKSLLNSLNWPTDLPSPAGIAKLINAEAEVEKSIGQLKNNEQITLQSIADKIAELESELEKGNLKHAARIQQLIKKELPLVERNQTKHLQSSFQSLSSELDRLNDWKGFAAEPKFIELCENMESLVESTLEPKDLSDAIQLLQNQWKSLGGLGDKKQHNLLWARFKTASDKAYLPCQAFYDQKSNSRAFNLEQRQEICEQLEALFQMQNWDNANWKGLQKIIDKAFHEYKKFAPVDRAANTAIQARFNTATTAIKQKLGGYYQVNLDAKQALIDECSALLESDDINSAIERCKTIQNTWKTLESAGKSEQALWIKFREKCDAIFELRNQAFQAKKAQTDTLIESAQNIAQQAKLLEASPSNDSLKQLAQYKQDIQQLDIPEKIKVSKINGISTLETLVKSNIEQASKNQDVQSWVNAHEFSAKIAQWEIDPDTSLESFESLQTLINQTELPKAVLEILLERLNSPASINTTTNAETLKAHCLDYEIAMGIDSPTGDQQARMAAQIKRLQENMGKQQPTRQQGSTQAQLDWFGFSGKAQGYQDYQARFLAALKQATS